MDENVGFREIVAQDWKTRGFQYRSWRGKSLSTASFVLFLYNNVCFLLLRGG